MILADAIRPGLRVVFCGTALGAVSARKRAYYAGPGNVFYETSGSSEKSSRAVVRERGFATRDSGLMATAAPAAAPAASRSRRVSRPLTT